MAKVLRTGLTPEEGAKELLKHLLESGKVEGVIGLDRVEGGAVAYSLLTSSQAVCSSVPLYPLMPVNLGQILTRFTLKQGVTGPVAVLARPCELRAFVETVKRRQGRMENLLFISQTCAGVFPLDRAVEGSLDAELPGYWDTIGRNDINPDLRTTCQSCEEFTPYIADLTLRVVDGGETLVIVANNDKGEGMLAGMHGGSEEGGLDLRRISALLEKRKEARSLIVGRDADLKGINGLVKTFGRCIGCHACSKACPICYCTSCTYESTTFERKPEDHARELEDKQGVRLPSGTVFFHLGRMVHMALSCVACGSCQDVCPVDIPVAIAFKQVGESLQKRFDYVPGRDIKEVLPVSTFKVEEFPDIEGQEVIHGSERA